MFLPGRARPEIRFTSGLISTRKNKGLKHRNALFSSSPALAHRLSRKRKLQTLAPDKLLELLVKLCSVLHRDHGDSICRFNGVGIALARDHLGAHNIQYGFQHAVVE